MTLMGQVTAERKFIIGNDEMSRGSISASGDFNNSVRTAWYKAQHDHFPGFSENTLFNNN